MFHARTYLKRGEKSGVTSKAAVENILKMLKFDPALYAVFEIWDKETQGLVKNCEAVGLQGSKICVKVPSVVHRQELLYMKESLLKRMNQALGKRTITDIQFELS